VELYNSNVNVEGKNECDEVESTDVERFFSSYTLAVGKQGSVHPRHLLNRALAIFPL
jgi:hypothetical protein